MKKYIVLYKAPGELNDRMISSTPEQQAEGMKAWMSWAKKCGTHLVDLGNPLANSTTIGKKGKTQDQNHIAGFSILEAKNKEAALELLKGHPHLAWSDACTIDVLEAQPIPGM